MNSITVTPGRTQIQSATTENAITEKSTTQKTDTDRRDSDRLRPVDQKVAAALLELDLEVARPQSRRAGLTPIAAQRKELAESKRANRSRLDDIAASLGVSRSTMNRILDEPPLRFGGRQSEERHGEHMRHAHGVGRRRHAGAGIRMRGLVLG